MGQEIPIGEIAGITTSLLWTIGSILHSKAAKRIGPFNVNTIRIFLSLFFVISFHIISVGSLFPDANISQWLFLGLSALIGLVIGDFAYFAALYYVGPRRSVLLLSTSPIFSVVMAYFILHEVLGIITISGIVITMSGVMMVLTEKEDKTGETPLTSKEKALGMLAGFIASIGQGIGLVISKYGMINAAGISKGPLNPMSATMIRTLTAAVVIGFGVSLSGRTKKVLIACRDKTAMLYILGGTITGPFLGIWLSMVAVSHTAAGIAATLMSLMPVMIVPILYLLYRQKTSLRSFIGACLTVAGVAILFLN